MIWLTIPNPIIFGEEGERKCGEITLHHHKISELYNLRIIVICRVLFLKLLKTILFIKLNEYIRCILKSNSLQIIFQLLLII